MKYVIDIMREPKTCDADYSISDAAKILKKEKIGSLIVVDGKNEIVGVVTERDLVHRVLAEEKDYKNLKIRDVMTTEVYTLKPYDTLLEAISLMREKKIKRIPIVKNNKIIGIITEREIVNSILKASEEEENLNLLKDFIFSY